jgi:DNA polymerase/3'-5' exonuclease PolX
LNKLLKVYRNNGDKGRTIAYSRAIATMKALNYEIKTIEDIQRLKATEKHISDKIANKINELLKTGSITKLEELKNSEENVALEEITRVWGIGAVKAREIYRRGVRTVEDLEKEAEKHP